MFFRERVIQRSLIGVVLACLLGQSAARAGDVTAAYESQVGYALHLLEAGRYGEAEDAAQNLIIAYPNAAMPYELRGTTALYVGSLSRAQEDFAQASAISQDPTPRYGLALCGLFSRKWEAAREALTQAEKLPNVTAAQAADLETARAYTQMLNGDAAGALATVAKGSHPEDPFRAEVTALATYRTDPKAGAALLAKFLTTPGGVPRVRENDGIRPLFESKRPLEPCVTEPDLQQMYADRLAGSIAEAAQRVGTIRDCSGMTNLEPPPALPAQTALISYAVDGEVAALVNQPPYTFPWNTRRVANGLHTIRTEAVDSSGNSLLTRTQTVRVANKDAVIKQVEDNPATPALKERLWNLLRLRPCRKVAEWTLAQAALASGDRVSADSYLEVAAALDPDYKEGRRFARALFGSPIATVAHVASSKPLVLWTGNPSGKQVALTFDDGPNPLKTPALLDALERAQAPATFFVVGSRAEQAPALLRRMAERGDEVENHSYTHPNMNLLIPSVAETEILRGNVLIQAMTGHQPRFFRPPGGNANAAVQHLSRAYGLSLAYWTVDALHAEDAGSAPELIQYVMQHVRPGAIILLHNAPDVTTAAVPGLVAALRAKGYRLVTLSAIARGQTGAKSATTPKMKE